MDHLGFPSVPSVSNSAAVQARKADIKYQRYPVGKLTWRTAEAPNEEHVIDSNRIISLIPVSQFIDDDYSLLYVEIADSTTDTPEAERTYFRSLMITRPPADIIKDFSPSGRSCWALRHDHDFAALIKKQLNVGKSPVQVILSTKSGQGSADKVYENLIRPMLIHNGCATHDVHRTTSSESVSEICRETILPAARCKVALMTILVSGDGGAVDLVNSLFPPTTDGDFGQASSQPPEFEAQYFCLVPVGTGNALAHSCNLTRDRTLGLASMIRGFPEPLPTFTVRFSPPASVVVPPSEDMPPTPPAEQEKRVAELHGAVVFSWALHAALVADSDTPAYRKLGAERFQIAAKENLFPPNNAGPHPYRGRLSIKRANSADWEEVSRESHSYLLATLCSKLEEKFTISPASRPMDGKLRIVHFGPQKDPSNSMSGEHIVGLMQKAYDGGKHVTDPAVSYEEIEKLRLEMQEDDDQSIDDAHGGPGKWRRVCVDGTIFKCEPGTVIEVEAPRRDTSVVVRMVSGWLGD